MIQVGDLITATLDTNVLASGARKLDDPTSTPGQILDRWIEGQFVLICSVPIIDELTRTLNNRYLRRFLTAAQIDQVLLMLQEESVMTEISVDVHGVAPHTADDLILATAVSAASDFLVTGDQGLLQVGAYTGVRIVSPRAFLDILEQTNPASR